MSLGHPVMSESKKVLPEWWGHHQGQKERLEGAPTGHEGQSEVSNEEIQSWIVTRGTV